MTNRRKKYFFIIFTLLIIACGGLCFWGIRYVNNVSPSSAPPEAIFSRYLSYSDNNKLFRSAKNIQADELGMGQGVYLRFEVDKELVFEFLQHDRENPYSYHYPYQSVACEEFYEVYANWADKWNGYTWWKPREIISPECYVTRGCEYFLFDKNSQETYYYFFPDFLGRDYLCVKD